MNIQEQQWVEAAKRGDQDAFACLVGAYEKRVFALTIRMCKQPEDAAEAAQEAFLAAWQGLEGFREESSFSTWLYRLASNACVDLLRREGRRQAAVSLDDEELRLDAPSAAPGPQELAEGAELRAAVARGLDALSPDHRQVLVLRELGHLSYEEIAGKLALDLGTVKSRISRARSALRKILLESGNLSGYLPSNRTKGSDGEEGR